MSELNIKIDDIRKLISEEGIMALLTNIRNAREEPTRMMNKFASLINHGQCLS
jgi:hypothetical protein